MARHNRCTTKNYKMARVFLAQRNLDNICLKLAQGKGSWAPRFCRAFELIYYFVGIKKHFVGLTPGPFQNGDPQPHWGNWEGDYQSMFSAIFEYSNTVML